MNIHIQNIGDCQKCGLALTSFLSNLSKYNLSKIKLTDKANECDLLLIVGSLTIAQHEVLMDFWKKMPRTSQIYSFGDCGTDNQDLFNFNKEQNLKNQAIPKDDLSEILPIDDTIAGCPPTLNEIKEKIAKINE